MLEKPALPDEKLITCLRDDYDLRVAHIDFLPIGADVNTAVYRAIGGGSQYFVKLRRGPFDETSVAVPRFLCTLGIRQVITPIKTQAGRLWTRLDAYTVVIYPYRPGLDGYAVPLSTRQWLEFGSALKGLHMAVLPESLARRISRETYSARWREEVRMFQARIDEAGERYRDPVAAETAAFLQARRTIVSHLVERAGRLAGALRARPLEYVLCHGDMHPGNVLIAGDDSLYVVDWDTLIFAPKERDLALVGGGGTGAWRSERGATLFYAGYGPTEIDREAIAYYRYERIIEDIAAFCEQLLQADEGGEDREQGFRYLTSNFLPGNDIEAACRSDLD